MAADRIRATIRLGRGFNPEIPGHPVTHETEEREEGFGVIEPRADDDARLVALMLRVRGNDEAAFRELVEATEDRVYGTIVKMLSGVEGAEDLAQKDGQVQHVDVLHYEALGPQRAPGQSPAGRCVLRADR
jgi:hypothetical protein